MPQKRYNRSRRKIKRKTPSKKISIIIKKRKKTNKHFSSLSKKPLQAVDSSKSAKSFKRPNRPFGGNLTSSEAREVIKYKALLESKKITLEQIPLIYHRFLESKKNQKDKN